MMKLFFSLLFFFLFYLTSKSQLVKNTWLISGSGSLYSYKEDYATPTFSQTAKYTNIDVAASLGYFIIDKLVIGLRPNFSSYRGYVTVTPGGTNQYKLGIGPFVRYYFLNQEKPFNLLFDGSYQFGINKFTRPPREQGKFNELTLMAGSEIFFNSSIGMEILFGYASKILSIDDSQSAFNRTRKGFQTSIGFTFHLEKL